MKRPLTLQQARSQYPHRYTIEHKPEWVKIPHNGKFYAPQYKSDLEWYENTLFPGEAWLGKKEKYGHSTGQTWPLGQWLESEFFIKGSE